MKSKSTKSTKTMNRHKAAQAGRSAAKLSHPAPAQAVSAQMAAPAGVAHPASKKGAIEALIRRPQGGAMSELVAATGWQKHSVRSALTLLRKAGCTITCDHADGGTRYRIVERAGVTSDARSRTRELGPQPDQGARPE